jgi:predicted phage terminase large subunit-like protein
MVYTKASTANTEPMVVNMLNRNYTERCRIEANNAGTIFARNVRNQLRISGNNKCYVEEFKQTKNKVQRILDAKDEVPNTIIFPHNWQTRWNLFYTHVTSFRAEGKNAHDDAPDVLTGIVESVKSGSGLISVFTAKANDYHNN